MATDLRKRILRRGARVAFGIEPIRRRFPQQVRKAEAVVGRWVMDDRDSLHDFWRQPAPEGNVPWRYTEHIGRSEVLVEILGDLPKDAAILEVGCNVGRNLAYLHDHGWTSVEGVEISPHAVDLLRQHYPQLADAAIHLGPAESILPTLGGRDVVFTMAVIEHLHPDSAAVFDQIARLAGRMVVAIEPTANSTHRQFPHDVVRIFTERGFTLVAQVAMDQHPSTAGDPAMQGYQGYRFERTPAAV